ncbi:LysE family translocator [Psychroflexus halocasei]|uniref:Threonine/homoserine/homoserine lactone efflux protein n=1 Tax=Psychroflexus halocasei TaxID=908615 RepID=A0A1H4D028_9FLAO|nr:LysE family transporter [Psychroflexus halocasei]SEA66054.1 Threonine/homoserine/homoserine lactone efflux protein [Psychroflexus halocasei]
MVELQVYILTYLAALAGVIPPGLINMSVAKACLNRGKRAAFMMAVGASIIVLIQATVSVLLSSYIFNHPFVKGMLLRTGLVILILMMLYFLFTAIYSKSKNEISKSKSSRSFLNGLLIATLNVFPIPYFVVLSTVFGSEFEFKFTIINIILFALSAALGTFTTLYAYIVFFIKIEDKTTTFKKYSNYFMAALMLILACVTTWRIYYKGG